MSNTLYEQDFYAWTNRQAQLLRAGRFYHADIDNIVEEIEAMGRSEKRELVNRLSQLLLHLLKWRYQPDFRSSSWRLKIEEQRDSIAGHLRDNPSLKSYLDPAMEDAYRGARRRAAHETGLLVEAFPQACPIPFAEAVDTEFWPD